MWHREFFFFNPPETLGQQMFFVRKRSDSKMVLSVRKRSDSKRGLSARKRSGSGSGNNMMLVTQSLSQDVAFLD